MENNRKNIPAIIQQKKRNEKVLYISKAFMFNNKKRSARSRGMAPSRIHHIMLISAILQNASRVILIGKCFHHLFKALTYRFSITSQSTISHRALRCSARLF